MQLIYVLLNFSFFFLFANIIFSMRESEAVKGEWTHKVSTKKRKWSQNQSRHKNVGLCSLQSGKSFMLTPRVVQTNRQGTHGFQFLSWITLLDASNLSHILVGRVFESIKKTLSFLSIWIKGRYQKIHNNWYILFN